MHMLPTAGCRQLPLWDAELRQVLTDGLDSRQDDYLLRTGDPNRLDSLLP